jgi:hypothetical protein
VDILVLQTLYCIELLFIWYEVWVVKIFLSDLTFNTTDVGLSPRYPLQVLRFPDACPWPKIFVKTALAFFLNYVKAKSCWNKMKIRKYNSVGAFPNSSRKVLERDKIDTPNTGIHDRLCFWLGTCIVIKSGEVKLVLSNQTSPS